MGCTSLTGDAFGPAPSKAGGGAVLGALMGAGMGAMVGAPIGGIIGEATMPTFPSKPPKPNKVMPITSFFKSTGDKPIVGQLARQVEVMLNKEGYNALRYFRFQNHGFAIATPVEQFDETTGYHVSGSRRFVASLTNRPQISGLLDYLRRVTTGKQGQYRMFVILATNERYEYSDDRISDKEWEYITQAGVDSLSNDILNGEWNSDVRVKLLVYEFEKRAGIPADPASAPQDAEWHFKASGLLAAAR